MIHTDLKFCKRIFYQLFIRESLFSTKDIAPSKSEAAEDCHFDVVQKFEWKNMFQVSRLPDKCLA